ncbi:meiotic PUF protein 1 [Mucor velutinosus]|uniref:Meiotic PUF protein 1 n=1 Tax=Mucor velutinosus TaxID=708070 RepID=A0AAN7DC23_9FUNG|nr:meiotic PUF protein 1 [Mucor velutinosus]
MVVCQHPQVERSVNAPINAQSDNVRERQRYWMGLLMEESAGPWFLDSGRGSPIDQLEGTTSCIYSPQNFPSAAEFNSANLDRQRNQLILHQQARWNSLSSANGIGNAGLDMVSPQSHNDSGPTHSRHSQQDRRLRVSAPVFQESMGDQAADILTDTASLGTFFH